MRYSVVAVITIILGALIGSAAFADGAFFTHKDDFERNIARALSEPEQKALIYFHDHTEDLIISPSYQGPVDKFAWIVPVPSKPKVEIMPPEIFREVLLATYQVQGPSNDEPAKSVEVLERKVIGSYDVSVLSASDSGGLMQWLETNNYCVPKKAESILQDYISEGWTFVASKIVDLGAQEGLRTGSLAPLRLTFQTNRPIYPLKLSAINPEPFDLMIHLLLSVPKSGMQLVHLYPAPRRAYKPFTTMLPSWVCGIERDDCIKRFPALAKLVSSDVLVFELTDPYYNRVRPENCIADLSWELWIRLPSQKPLPSPLAVLPSCPGSL